MLKRILIGSVGIVLSVVVLGAWLFSLLDLSGSDGNPESVTPQELSYLDNAVQERRGRILAVVTSTDTMGATDKPTGYELTELSRAYYVFTANGFEVDIASPRGGEPPVVIDDDDMGPFDFAFLNDPVAQRKTANTIATADVDPDDYAAVYFVGGKGAMFDFPDDAAIQALVSGYDRSGKVIGAICHGPAALVNVRLEDGTPLVASRRVSSFTNEEELFLIPDAEQIFPFLLEDELVSRGALFEAAPAYLEQVSHDDNLVTGQNPWSVWPLAEAMIRQLGYTPIQREVTGEENSVAVLAAYELQGYRQARGQLRTLIAQHGAAVNRNLIVMHGIVAAMQWDLAKSVQLVRLASVAKRLQTS